jgi:hypothetical protein
MFVANVESVNGPNGKIAAIVRFYLAYDQVEKFRAEDVYLLFSKRTFKGVAGGILANLLTAEGTSLAMVPSQA